MNDEASFIVNVNLFNDALGSMEVRTKNMADIITDLMNEKKQVMDSWEGEIGANSVISKLDTLITGLEAEHTRLVNLTKNLADIIQSIIETDNRLANR
jgi:uncharacterized protein YukE